MTWFFLYGDTLELNSVAFGLVFKSFKELEEVNVDTPIDTILKQELS